MKTSCFKYYTGDMGVAICIYPPLDWSGLRFPALEPTRAMFFAVKNGQINHDQYQKLYREEVLSRLDAHEIYKMFKNNVLLCWEAPGEFCHRRIVANWIKENTGYDVPEWTRDDEKIDNLSKSKKINPLF